MVLHPDKDTSISIRPNLENIDISFDQSIREWGSKVSKMVYDDKLFERVYETKLKK